MPLSTRHLHWIAIATAVVVLVAHNVATQPWTLDDAYISFRYAENLVAGDGLVFNPGERVEGYTNFLWVMGVAALNLVGLGSVEAAKLMGAVCTISLMAMMASAHRIIPQLDERVSAVLTLIVGTCGITTRWSLSGMEVPLVMLLVAGALMLHMRARTQGVAPRLEIATGVIAGLAMMTRPDTALIAVAMGLDRLWQSIGPRRASAAPLVRLTAAAVLVYAPYFLWRYDYYGWFLPNTFYVKVGSTSAQLLRGLVYLKDFLEPGWGLLAGGVLGFALRSRLPKIPGMGALYTFLLLHLAYIIYVGGDVFWGFRFFAVMLLPLGLLTAMCIVHGVRARPLGVVALAGLVIINIANMTLHGGLKHRGVVSEWGLQVGEFFAKHAPEDALLATNIAGSIPWASGLEVIDTLGLNDVTIAHTQMPHMGRGRAGHEKGNGEYVLSREPDYVIFASSRGARRPKFAGDRQLYRSDDFHDAYALRVYALESGLRLWLYVRRQSHGGRDLPVQPLVVGVNPFARGRLVLPGGVEEPDDTEHQE